MPLKKSATPSKKEGLPFVAIDSGHTAAVDVRADSRDATNVVVNAVVGASLQALTGGGGGGALPRTEADCSANKCNERTITLYQYRIDCVVLYCDTE